MIKKLRLYTHGAVVEVNDDGEVYISQISWKKYFQYRFARFLHMIEFDKPFSARLLMPWKITMEDNGND
jgi:hypothetical protein